MLGLSKKNIQRLLSFASADDNKKNIRGIRVEQGTGGTYNLYSTDGYRLLKITVPDREYTLVPMGTKTITTPRIILSGVLERLTKIINKNSAKLPMADKAWIHDDGIYYNNLECNSDKVIIEAKEVFLEGGHYPEVETILGQFKDKPFTIALNAALLSEVAKTFKNSGTSIVKLTIGEKSTSPILLEGTDEEQNKIQAVLMPIRTSDDL